MLIQLWAAQLLVEQHGPESYYVSELHSRVFGENKLYSVLSLCLVVFGFGYYYSTVRSKTLTLQLWASISAVVLLSVPVMVYRGRQVLDQWGYNSVLPILNVSPMDYVSLQNAFSACCGIALITFSILGRESEPHHDAASEMNNPF